MVKGLELFREHFRAYADRYILIGGTACDLAMTEAGLEFRATRDLDIVLFAESIDTSFAKAFWEFVQTGGYQLQEASSGRKKFYRFQKPTNPDFPAMLELFSRVPDALAIADHSDLTPIPIDDEVSSLSAILVDDAYYGWIRDGKRDIAGVPILGPEHMIPLKARAWLDLRDRKASGEAIDSKDIKKHKNDVFRIYAIIDPEFRASLPATINTDMRRFLREVADEHIDLKAFGLGSGSVESVLDSLRAMYL